MNRYIDIHVVLVKPLYSRNVGYVSRVMANMGAAKLILVDSQCEYNLEARQGAAGAQTHLVEATHYKTVDDFLKNEPEGLRVAFSARTKKETDTLPTTSRARMVLTDAQRLQQPIYLLFGSEDHGLTKEDLEYAHYILELPIFGPFKSINLSHATLLALYIFQNEIRAVEKPSHETENFIRNEISKPESTGFVFPKLALKEWLETLGFETGDRRTDALQVLQRILLKNLASNKELRVLEAIVNQTVRKLKRPSSS
jgi:tRNA/rRNA methyltransferase